MARRLTLEFGFRFTHFAPWVDALGFGFSVFDPTSSLQAALCSPTHFGIRLACQRPFRSCGRFPARAHSTNPVSVPRTRFRSGTTVFAADGAPSTILRPVHQQTWTHRLVLRTANLSPRATWVGSSWLPNQRAQCSSHCSPLTYPASIVSATPASPAAVDRKDDDKQPYTDSYSVNVDRHGFSWSGFL